MTDAVNEDPAYQEYLAAERRFGQAKVTCQRHDDLLPYLRDANEAWRKCFVPRLRKRTEDQERIRRLATSAITARLAEMDEEERMAIRLVFGIG